MMSNTSSDMEHCSNLTKESEFSGLTTLNRAEYYGSRRLLLLLLLQAESNSHWGFAKPFAVG